MIWRLALSGHLAYGKRAYDHFFTGDSLETRRDETWQMRVILDKVLNSRMAVFLDGVFVHQTSNVGGIGYDQARFGLGISATVISAPEARFITPEANQFTPIQTSSGIRFRHEAASASSVSLVGGFNGWDPDANPLRRTPAGLWETVLPLDTGIWRYTFVVDEVWVRPLDAPRYEEDGFGGVHGVLEVSVPKRDGSVTGEDKRRPNYRGTH